MADQLYPSFLVDQGSGRIDWERDTIKTMLLGEAYKFSKLHRRRSDLDPFEVAAPGYDKGGAILNDRRLVPADIKKDGLITPVLNYQAAPAFWPAPATISARYAATYKSRGGPGEDDELICLADFGKVVASMNGPYRIRWDPEGVFSIESSVEAEEVG